MNNETKSCGCLPLSSTNRSPVLQIFHSDKNIFEIEYSKEKQQCNFKLNFQKKLISFGSTGTQGHKTRFLEKFPANLCHTKLETHQFQHLPDLDTSGYVYWLRQISNGSGLSIISMKQIVDQFGFVVAVMF